MADEQQRRTQSLHLLANLVPVPDNAQPNSSGSAAASASDEESGFFYIPNFITEEEETYLTQKVSWRVLTVCRSEPKLTFDCADPYSASAQVEEPAEPTTAVLGRASVQIERADSAGDARLLRELS